MEFLRLSYYTIVRNMILVLVASIPLLIISIGFMDRYHLLFPVSKVMIFNRAFYHPYCISNFCSLFIVNSILNLHFCTHWNFNSYCKYFCIILGVWVDFITLEKDHHVETSCDFYIYTVFFIRIPFFHLSLGILNLFTNRASKYSYDILNIIILLRVYS